MMERKGIGRLLRVLLVALMLSAAWLLVQQALELRERDKRITELALARYQQMIQVRLDAMFGEWEEDLTQEAVAVRSGMEDAELLRQWSVVMDNHWELLSIRLADEQGNELALHREDTALVVVRTTLGSKGGEPRANVLSAASDSLETSWTRFGTYDPRERIWFSKALENNRETPIWTIRQFGDSSEHVLQLSILASRARENEVFRVLLFDVSLDRAEAMDHRSTGDQRMALLTSDGDLLLTRSGGGIDSPDTTMASMLDRWTRTRTERIHRTDAHAASFEPYPLNGLNLVTAVLLDAAPLNASLAAERRFYRLAIVWIATLAAVLLGMLVRSGFIKRSRTRLALHNMQLEHRLSKAMGARDVLSREVHHRVKNNLQVVSSLLNLQASSLNDNTVRDEFLRGKRRIDTIALVHHRLYDHPDLRNIDLRGFLHQLTSSIADLQTNHRRTVSIGVECNGLKADQDTAIELGIIVCELVTNAYQHAFPHATGGHINVVVERVEGDLHRLVVSNNGVAADRALLSGPGKLGLEIVEALAEQLDGSLHVRTEGSPAFEILFRMKRPGSADIADA
jgi:two-component sensor histidine kinase